MSATTVFLAMAKRDFDSEVTAVCASHAQAVRALAEQCAQGGRLDCSHDSHSVDEYGIEADGESYPEAGKVYRRTYIASTDVYQDEIEDAARPASRSSQEGT